MSDKYDDAIQFLTNRPEQIREAWHDPWDHPAGCLFMRCTPSGTITERTKKGEDCGCLTQVASVEMPAFTPKLTKQIRADERIPKMACDITVKSLPVFAEWQRKLDATIRA